VSAAFDGTDLYLGGGTVTIGSTTYGGSAVALNPSTGAIVWQDHESSPVLASGVLAPGVLVFTEAGGLVHIVRTDTGAELASYSLPAPLYSAVAINNGVLYVPTGAGTLVALS
jgi:outer membrane protein assembly factor BamB